MILFDIFEYFQNDFPILQTSISALVAFVLGFFWYHPKVMGDQWAEAHDIETRPGFVALLVALIMWVMTSMIYSFLSGFLTPPSVGALLGLSTFLWIGFVLPSIMLNGLYSGKKLNAIAIDSSYFLAGLYLFAVIHDVI